MCTNRVVLGLKVRRSRYSDIGGGCYKFWSGWMWTLCIRSRMRFWILNGRPVMKWAGIGSSYIRPESDPLSFLLLTYPCNSVTVLKDS